MIVRTDDTNYKDIANAIRSKLNSDAQMLPSQMADNILAIQTDTEDTDVKFSADVEWARQICIDDVQEGFTYKILQLFADGYVSTDINIPSNGAAKTSDGAYYTSEGIVTHTWNPEYDIQSEEYSEIKLRWVIIYYPTGQIGSTSSTLLPTARYICFNALSAEIWLSNFYQLEYFENINEAASKFTIGWGTDGAFENCHSLKTIPEVDTTRLYRCSNMFANCYALETLPEIDTSKAITCSSMFSNCHSLKTVPTLNTSNSTDFSGMFDTCSSLKTIPKLDTSKGTRFSRMFSQCCVLQSLPELDTSNAITFEYMFYQCYSLKTLPKLNTSNAYNFSDMFNSCHALITLPEFDTSSGTDFSGMCYFCYALSDIPALNVSKGTKFTQMFGYCRSLEKVPAFDTSSGTAFSQMFKSCDSLQTITQLDMNAGTDFSNVFGGAAALEYVNLLNIGKSLDISISTKFSRETIVNGVLNNLKDLTGQTAQTLTIGSTNLTKLTEEDKLIATNKNWNLR